MSDNLEQNSDASTESDQSTVTNAPSMPDGLPENFWDAENGQVKVEDLVGSYKELSTFKSEAEAKYANRPESADKYELRVPEGIEGLPADFSLEGAKDSPLLKAVQETVFNAGGSQQEFDNIVKAYLQDELSAQAAEQEQFKTELASLGQNADARIEAVNTYLSANLPEDKARALSENISSAKALEALEDLIKGNQDANVNTGGDQSGNSTLNLQELRKMQDDPRYWRDRDPAFMNQVNQGYQKLYSGNKNAG